MGKDNLPITLLILGKFLTTLNKTVQYSMVKNAIPSKNIRMNDRIKILGIYFTYNDSQRKKLKLEMAQNPARFFEKNTLTTFNESWTWLM